MSTGPPVAEAQNFRELLLAVESALQAPDAADLAELQENLLRALPSFQRLLDFPASPRYRISSTPNSARIAPPPRSSTPCQSSCASRHRSLPCLPA